MTISLTIDYMREALTGLTTKRPSLSRISGLAGLALPHPGYFLKDGGFSSIPSTYDQQSTHETDCIID
jgi:hypothetical protein